MPPEEKDIKKKTAPVETDEFGQVRPILNKLQDNSGDITSQELADALSYFIEREKKAATSVGPSAGKAAGPSSADPVIP